MTSKLHFFLTILFLTLKLSSINWEDKGKKTQTKLTFHYFLNFTCHQQFFILTLKLSLTNWEEERKKPDKHLHSNTFSNLSPLLQPYFQPYFKMFITQLESITRHNNTNRHKETLHKNHKSFPTLFSICKCLQSQNLLSFPPSKRAN